MSDDQRDEHGGYHIRVIGPGISSDVWVSDALSAGEHAERLLTMLTRAHAAGRESMAADLRALLQVPTYGAGTARYR